MHAVPSPYRPPLRRSSWSRWTVIRAPDAASALLGREGLWVAGLYTDLLDGTLSQTALNDFLDQFAVRRAVRVGIFNARSNQPCDLRLNGGCGNSRYGAGLLLLSADKRRADVIAIPDSAFDREARAHAVAPVVVNQAGEKGARLVAPSRTSFAVGSEEVLHFIEQVLIDDRQFINSMIPHHSGAILMCGKADLADRELVELCEEIIRAQRDEIELMNAIRARLDRRSPEGS
jgi:hypothetical protein